MSVSLERSPRYLSAAIALALVLGGVIVGSFASPAVADVVRPELVLGDFITDVAAAPDGSVVVAASSFNQELVLIDSATGLPSGSPIALGIEPDRVVVSPDSGRAYVMSRFSRELVAVDLESRMRVGSPVALGRAPDEMAMSDDGLTLYVTLSSEGLISVVDALALRERETLPVGGHPSLIALTGGESAVVADSNGAMRSIDLRTGSVVLGPVTVATQLFGLTLDRSRTVAYISSGSDRTVKKVDLLSLTEVASSQVLTQAPHGLRATPDGTRILVTVSMADAVVVVDSSTLVVSSQTLATGERPLTVAVAADGSAAFTANQVGQSVSMIELDAAPSIVPETLPAGVEGAKYSAQLQVGGRPAPSVAVTSPLPSGMRFDAATGALVWDRPVAGTYTLGFTAENVTSGFPMRSTRSYTLEIAPLGGTVPPGTTSGAAGAGAGAAAQADGRQLAQTGADPVLAVSGGASAFVVGVIGLLVATRRRAATKS